LADKGGAVSVKHAKPKRREVDIHNSAELRAWAKYWGCTQQDIRDAVHTAGVMVMDAQDWLKINVLRVRHVSFRIQP